MFLTEASPFFYCLSSSWHQRLNLRDFFHQNRNGTLLVRRLHQNLPEQNHMTRKHSSFPSFFYGLLKRYQVFFSVVNLLISKSSAWFVNVCNLKQTISAHSHLFEWAFTVTPSMNLFWSIACMSNCVTSHTSSKMWLYNAQCSISIGRGS